MSRAPVCPVCGSTAVSSDPTNGGAGRNVCHCGHRAPVRDFYEWHDPAKAAAITATGQSILREALGRYGRFAEKPNEPITREQYSALYLQSPEYFPIPDGYKWDNKTGTIVPKPGKVNYVTEPVAAVLMPNGELNDMQHNREPAPIRQYKDDD